MGKVKYITYHYAYDNTAKGIVEHIQYLKSTGCEIFDIELMDGVHGKMVPRYLVAEERDSRRWDWCKDGDIVYGFDRDKAYNVNRPNEKVSYERWCEIKKTLGENVGTFLGEPFEKIT